MTPLSVCRLSLAACVTIGVCLMVFGVFVVPALAYIQLDFVLTPQQLADPQTRQSTLALLQKAGGATWRLWVGAGLTVVVCAGIGLVSSFRRAAWLAERASL